ncbi:hypothetical protein Tco_1323210, partial [Tanacetum coccineum]
LNMLGWGNDGSNGVVWDEVVMGGFCVEEQALVAMDFLKVVEEALEQALSLFEFQGFSSFDGRKLVHVVNGIKSVVNHGIISHSLVWRSVKSVMSGSGGFMKLVDVAFCP